MTRRFATVLATASSMVLSASTLWAHPGHGQIPSDTPAHYLFEPLHAIPLLAFVALIAGAAFYAGRARHR